MLANSTLTERLRLVVGGGAEGRTGHQRKKMEVLKTKPTTLQSCQRLALHIHYRFIH